MTSIQQHIRVRFAPSPTGHLHIGGLRTAIFNWLFARHNNGKFLIRIEDTDIERSKPEYTESILQSFAWMAIASDEPIVIQSERLPEHRKVADELIAQGKAYRCFCSQEEVIERHKQKTGSDDLFVKYDGKCKNKKVLESDLSRPYVIRFALPYKKGAITWLDLIRGEVTFDADQFDDFIIVRSDGMPMYNFVVVIDDAFMKISHVIRGEEHLSNTPKQILLYQACGYALPQFAHLPMILGPSGEKLSKRDGAVSVLEYKLMGYLPDALFNYLVRLGWAHGDQEVFTRDELIKFFTLEAIQKKGAMFDQQKLDWLNGVYMRGMSDHELMVRIINDVMPDFLDQLPGWDEKKILIAIALYKDRVKTLRELAQEIIMLHGPHIIYNQEDMQQWIKQPTADYLKRIIETIEMASCDFTTDALSKRIKELATILGVKLVELAQPIRIALVGKSSSPGIFELLVLLGLDESKRRLQRLYDVIVKM